MTAPATTDGMRTEFIEGHFVEGRARAAQRWDRWLSEHDATVAEKAAKAERERLVEGLSGPIGMAQTLLVDGRMRGDGVSPENLTGTHMLGRGLWHALHYIERRLAGWDKLPDNTQSDQVEWEAHADRFLALAKGTTVSHDAAVARRAAVDELNAAADAIQALHPGEVKNSVVFLRARAARRNSGEDPTPTDLHNFEPEEVQQ